MNCLWIILLLSCFGCCGGNTGVCCGNACGCNNNRCGNNDSCHDREGQKKGCRRAVEKAVNECGSERAAVKALKEREREGERDCDCGCGPDRAERVERADNNSCDIPAMKPPHWQDFPEVSRSSSREDCGCDS